MRSGRFRHRFKLMKPKLGSDGEAERNEYGEETGDLTLVSYPWCSIIDSRNNENVSTAVVGQESIKFEIRYSKIFENPDTNMVIVFEDNKYDITSVVDPHRRREMMHITAVKRRQQ